MALLLEIAGKDKDKLTEIVEKVLENPVEELVDIEVKYESLGKRLYNLVKKNNIELSEADQSKLISLASHHISTWENGKAHDEVVALLWAKKHYKVQPITAYEIFISQDYTGKEVMEAMRLAFSEGEREHRQFSSREANVNIFKPEHLKEIYPTQDLSIKVVIAEHLEDTEALRGLSKEYEKKGDFSTAYHLWLSTKGDIECEYMNNLRQKMLKKEKKLVFISNLLLNSEDISGKTLLFDTFFKQNKFYRAFEMAQELKDEEKMQQARKKIVEASPEKALRHFTRACNDPDELIIDMAVKALGEKYDVPTEKIRECLKISAE
jgi:hypothetical protein